MKKLVLAVALALASCCDAGFTIARRFHYEPPIPPLPRNYVTNGLTHYWDAEFNAARDRHDGDATVWKDLVGNKDLTLIPHDLVKFTAHSAKFGYTSYYSPQRPTGMFTGGDPIPLDEIKSVEVCACFSKGFGDTDYGQNNVIFSNGATKRLNIWGSELGDLNSTAPYYYSLSYAAAAYHVGSIARMSTAYNNVGLTMWNIPYGTRIDGTGATFQNFIENGFTASGCVTNINDVGGLYSNRFWKPDTYVSYWGYYGQTAFTNDTPYTYGLGGAAAVTFTPTEPVGTGLTVGGVLYNGYPRSLFYGYIYAIRVYNRRLEIWERMHNADIDYEVFHGKKE